MEKLVVFDLDFTIWDAGGTWCDHTNPPYKKKGDFVEDSLGRKIMLYPEVMPILWSLRRNKISTAIASRTGEPSWARQLLSLFEIADFFDYKEIYPGSKIQHFTRLREQSGISFENMVFFDDEEPNIQDVGSLGVYAVLVCNGISLSIVNGILNVLWRLP